MSYSTTQACHASGLSYRMLDYWTREGALAPSVLEADGSGSRRVWSELDVARLEAIGEVARDLSRIGCDMPLELVELLWRRLVERPDAVVCEGTVTLSASRRATT